LLFQKEKEERPPPRLRPRSGTEGPGGPFQASRPMGVGLALWPGDPGGPWTYGPKRGQGFI